MGITIHYTGKIKHTRLIPTLTDEVKDICESFNWEYQLFDRAFPIGGLIQEEDETTPTIHIKGIHFTPPESETFNLTFMENGDLISIVKVLTILDMKEYEEMPWIHTKTQFAGPEIHIAVSKLLKYLSEKYFSDFKVTDEGEFWEEEDEAKTRATFKRYEFAINAFATALKNYDGPKAETEDGLVQQIENILKDLREKGEI